MYFIIMLFKLGLHLLAPYCQTCLGREESLTNLTCLVLQITNSPSPQSFKVKMYLLLVPYINY